MSKPLREVARTVMGGKPKLKQCEEHGSYSAFSMVLADGSIYEGRCPKCMEIEEELNPPRYEFEKIEVTPDMIRNRLIDSGVLEDFASITLDNMPQGLREIQPIMDAADKIVNGQMHNLVILGPNGVGKTTIAVAIMAEAFKVALESDRNISMHFTTEARLLRAMRTTYGRRDGPTEQDIINRMGRVGILVIDEIGKAKNSEYNMLAIEEIIDMRHKRLPTIICGNPTADDFKEHLTDSSRSKLGLHGSLIEINDRDHRRTQ